MLTAVLLLVAGLALLTFSADRFVLGAARLSSLLHVSPVIVGAVVIGFGTSAPELVVTVLATLAGSQDLAFGNVVGSNTANMLLVIGAAGLFQPIRVAITTLRRELPIMLVALAALSFATYNLRVTTLDALLVLTTGVLALGFLVRVALQDRESAEVLGPEVEDFQQRTRASRTWSAALLTVLGLVGTLVGAQLLVQGATTLARALGLSEAFIGLTIVAIGTSLPELVTAVAAARRGEGDLVVGNILGSNLFNSTIVAGTAGLLATVPLDPAFRLSVLLMLGANLVGAWFLRSDRGVSRVEGGVLLALFVVVTLMVA